MVVAFERGGPKSDAIIQRRVKVLTKDEIQQLYRKFSNDSSYAGWQKDYLETVKKFQALSDSELKNVEAQDALWKAKGVSTLGPGESVDVSSAYQDKKVVEQIVSLKSRQWHSGKNKRAKELQNTYDTILNKVYPKHSRVRPQAKLGRLFATLIPEHTTTGFNWKSRTNIKNLVLGDKNVEAYEGAVLIRDRLRSILGNEANMEEHIKRSTFCWWLHSNFDKITSGDSIDSKVIGDTDPTKLEENQELSIWPFIKQGKGLTAITGYINSYRLIIGASKNGATPEDIVDTMISDLGFKQSPSSCRSIFNNVRRMGFLEHKGGVWYPSEDGIRLIEEDPPDVLVEKFLVETFGLAHLLTIIEKNPGLLNKEIYHRMKELYPRWTSDMAPSSILAWAKSLGLVDTDEGNKPHLTEYGQIWCGRIPEELEKPTISDLNINLPSEDAENADDKSVTIEEPPRLSAILNHRDNDNELANFVFTDNQIESLHIAWHCNPIKRFVLLSGLSGTGKTTIFLHYARIYCELLGIDVNKHRLVVPVSPDWRDPTSLLGYFNALHADPTFQLEPALRLVLDAAKNPKLPYFLILDEMNLAKVERYFAPFLSAMETGDRLYLHAHSDEINGVPPSIKWPKNLFVGGTVNMDETTHPFSDKVLDRAFTFEFWDVDLEKYLENRTNNGKQNRHKIIEDFLLQIHEYLKPIRRQFAYRTTSEILDYFDKAENEGRLSDKNMWEIADQVVFAKILPRIRGEESEIFKLTLNNIINLCKSNELDKCTEKLETMQSQLTNIGVTRFWA